MDVLGATKWSMAKVVSRDEMLQRLEQRYGKITPAGEASSAPATRFLLSDGTVFGIIASTTAPFCRTCDRSRITADGFWYRCLYAADGTDLRKLVRGGAGDPSASRRSADAAIDSAIARVIEESWRGREDRGAEERAAGNHREAFIRIEELRRDPHLEMHTRGG
jgi:cyclic pyranopterin phosphate synthase